MEETPRTWKEAEGEEVNKPPEKKQESFKDFVRRIVSVPKDELNKQEEKYQQERAKKRKKR